MNKKLQGDFMLLLTSFIWGSSFVAQRAGMDIIGPYTFNGVRCYIGFLVLLPVIYFMGKRKGSASAGNIPAVTETRRDIVIGGICCGLCLFIASTLQQVGLVYTTAGKAGFVTALYVVIVPILGLVLGKRVRPLIWLCVVLSAVGLYLLCIKSDFSLGKGDALMLVCALFFAIHIIVIDHFTNKVDGVKLSCIQFLIAGIISTPFMFTLETPTADSILACWIPLGYTGVLSCGVGYTLQIVAQKYTEPAVASMILCLESVFAVLAGMLLLHEQITTRELIGCIIMFVAIVLAQLPEKENKLPQKE